METEECELIWNSEFWTNFLKFHSESDFTISSTVVSTCISDPILVAEKVGNSKTFLVKIYFKNFLKRLLEFENIFVLIKIFWPFLGGQILGVIETPKIWVTISTG